MVEGRWEGMVEGLEGMDVSLRICDGACLLICGDVSAGETRERMQAQKRI